MGRWPTLSLQERILKHVKKAENGCWEWTGSLTCATPGWHYGRINIAKTIKLAHRVSWEAFHGPLESSLDVLHKCDNCKCVNPEHLFVGGQTENNLDRDRKLRFHKKIGPEEVRLIRHLYDSGTATQNNLAKQYGLTQGHISDIVNYKRWPKERMQGINSGRP